MADLTAKVSAVRGDETETRSSMIQPSHVVPVEEFQAASVKIEHRPGILGLGSSLIKGIGYFGVERASLYRQRDQMMEAARVPASTPTGGREGNFRTSSQPSWKLMKLVVALKFLM
ncbi:hypothetical protein Bca4012_001741 [Brassica carinata]|uniref:Uncharacterized protein n=1 Tax=Brassica carinata TaxID=52824 RepID=A0A8X7V213_BRACI|nr:hypothetical protein Bca52824_043450 [Brassica carinata]